jgi:glutaredoxin-like protein NrdH
MIESLEYVHEEGVKRDHSVVVYALSTCGFCQRALGFLKNNGVDFRYVYVDNLPGEVKKAVKRELRERYRIKELFPTLIVDEAKALTGFDRQEWERQLGLA